MTFGEALDELVNERMMPYAKVRRKEWVDKEAYVAIRDSKLMIFTKADKQLHPLIVTTGDILGDDWVVC